MKRLLLWTAAVLLGMALLGIARWWTGPGRAVGRIEKAYARGDAAAAAPFLTAQGQRIFAAGLDPDWYQSPIYLDTEETARNSRTAVYRVNALTRFGPALAELRLVREPWWHWKLDEVYVVSLGGDPVGQTATALLTGKEAAR
jgi:hypothetical protein